MTNPLKLKVCGLGDLNQIETLIPMGVDFLGFIFYPKSPRYVLNFLSETDVRNINHPAKVGVFVNESIAHLQQIVPNFGLDYLQLHGDEDLAYVLQLKQALPQSKIIKVFRISAQNQNDLQATIALYDGLVDLFLFDTDAQSYGGTGHSFDWRVLNNYQFNTDFMLSGGVSADNLQDINIIQKKVFALDINSKFERAPADKNTQQIKEFKELLISNHIHE